MADDILTRSMLQSAELVTLSPRSVVVPAATWTLIADVQCLRLTLTVLRGSFTDPIYLSPIKYGAAGVFASIERPLPIQIHAAEFPLLISGQWWALSSGGQTLTILDTIRVRGV